MFFGTGDRYSVYLPEIVLMESINLFRERLIKGKQKIDTDISGILRNTGPELTNPITDDNIDAQVVGLEEHLHGCVHELGITIIRIPNPSHHDLVEQD